MINRYEEMKKFEAGKSYRVNDRDGGIVTVTRRTAYYVTIRGAYTGRFRAYRDNLFGMGENLCLPAFCFAAREI